MRALVLTNSGNATLEQIQANPGIDLADLSPYLTHTTEATRPKPRRGQVLVKVKLAAVNPSDLHYMKGEYGQARTEGIAAGFEGVGEVVETGGGLYGKYLMGKRVAFATGPKGTGSWAEYAVADAMASVPLKPGVSDEDGACFFVNPLTAVAMHGLVKPTGSRSFVMTAAGSQLCKLIIGLAKDEGTRPIALVRRDDAIEELKSLGAAHVLNIRDAQFLDNFATIAREEKTRLFLDAVGDDLSPEIFDRMGNRARWVIYGLLGSKLPRMSNPGDLIFRDKRIEGFWLLNWMRRASIVRQLATINKVQNRFISGRWKTDIAATIPLNEAMDRLPAALADAHGDKILLQP